MKLDDRANPVACSLSQMDAGERRGRWLRLSNRALSDKESTQAGIRLRFRPLEDVENELRELAALERECCSFAAWSVSSDQAHLILEVSAEGDAADVVRALFEDSPPSHADATARG